MSAAEAEEQALNESADDEEEFVEEDDDEGSAEQQGQFEAEEYGEEIDELESMEEDQPAVQVVAAPYTPVRTLSLKR